MMRTLFHMFIFITENSFHILNLLQIVSCRTMYFNFDEMFNNALSGKFNLYTIKCEFCGVHFVLCGVQYWECDTGLQLVDPVYGIKFVRLKK